jgi:hypothetical protein
MPVKKEKIQKADPSLSEKVSGSIVLPKPAFPKDKVVFKSLKERKTTRTISGEKMPLQVLSNLLWSACGVNRKTGPFGVPGITAASASNSQEINLYVLLQDAAYLYEAGSHSLTFAAAGDLRAMGIGKGQGPAGANAPVRIVYVVDIDKFSKAGFQEPGLNDAEIQKSYYFVDTGMIAGNVYLFAASQGLAAWFHNCDKEGLFKKLNLKAEQRALFGQTVGYAEKG